MKSSCRGVAFNEPRPETRRTHFDHMEFSKALELSEKGAFLGNFIIVIRFMMMYLLSCAMPYNIFP